MPYVLRPNKIYVKDPEGEGYLPGNVIAEETTEQMIADIEDAGDEQIAALEARGQEISDDWPDTYTELTQDVTDLKGAIGQTPMGTEADTVTGAIAEIGNNVSSETERATTAEGLKVNKPTGSPNGTSGQFLQTNGDGTTVWADPLAGPIDEAVAEWLDDHPEATTTVEDGSLTEIKFEANTLASVKNNYVTPEMFGAVGDGSTDDTQAIQDAFDSGYDVYFGHKTYKTTGVSITNECCIHFESTTLKAVTKYQDYIINLTKPARTTGRLILDGDYKAYNGIKITTGYGSDFDYIQAKKCLAWGVNINSSGISSFRHIETEYCGTVIKQTLSYYSSTSLSIDDTLSDTNRALLNSDYANNMFLRDISDAVSTAFPGGKTIKLATGFDSENNRIELYNTATNSATAAFSSRLCEICFGGGILLGSSVFTQINLGNISTKLGATGITFGCTYGMNIASYYSQSDYFPIAVPSYSLGNLFGSFSYEGSKSGYAMMSLWYDYSVIVARSTGYGTNFNANEICSIANKSDAHKVPVHLKTVTRQTIPLYYGLSETLNINEKSPNVHILRDRTGFTISLADKFQNNDLAYNPWGVKTVYFLPSSSLTSQITISLSSSLVEDNYTIAGGTNGQITFARPSRWFKVLVFLFDKVFTIVPVKLPLNGETLVIIESPTGDTHELEPYPVTYSFGEKSTLTVTVTATTQYRFMFKCPSDAPTALTINGINFTEGDTVAAGKTYMVDVWNGIASIKEMNLNPVINVGTDLVTLFIGRDANGKGLFVSGKDIDSSGNVVSGSKACSEVYLPINPAWTYAKSSNGRMYNLTFYDSSYTFISQVTTDKYNNLSNTTITDVPSNAAYIRFCTNSSTNNWGIKVTRTA